MASRGYLRGPSGIPAVGGPATSGWRDPAPGYSGKLKPEDDPKVLATEGERLLELCHAHGIEQEKLVIKLNDQSTDRVHERAEGRALIKQLDNVQQRWWGDFYRLQANYEKRKLTVPVIPFVKGVPQIQPTQSLVPMYEKKFPG